MLPQWHGKDPGHSAKSAGGKLHLNMHTPIAKQSRSGPTMLLSRHSVGTYQETSSHEICQGTFGQSSQLIEPLWTDPGIKSWISVHKLISTLKKQTKAQAGNEWLNILLKSSQVRKKPSPFAASIKHSMHCVTGGYLTKGHSYFCTLIWVMWAFALLVVNLSVNLPLIGRNQAFSELHSHFRDSLRAF